MGMDEHQAGRTSGYGPKEVAGVAVLILVGALMLNVLEALIRRWMLPDGKEMEQMEIKMTIEELKREAVRLNAPDTFAECAKAERKALRLEKELGMMKERDSKVKSHYLLKLPQTMRLVGLAWIVVLLGMNVKVVSYLDPACLWPLGRWMAVLSGYGGGSGVVGMVPWAVVCHRVTRAMVVS